MLDDPFVLPQQRPSATYFGHGGNGTSSTSSSSAATASTNSAPYSLLLSGHASKFKSSATRTLVVGKENGLLPSPRFGSSSSSSSSSSAGAPSSSSSPPRDGESSLLRKSLKPALKRRVTFSPTPLASLQSSPSHGKRPRPEAPAAAGLLFADEHERDAKRRRRRENVYSDNPLLEAARGGATAAAPTNATSRRPFGGADNDAESGSDVRPGGESSPPSAPSPEFRLVPLPRSPPRPLRTKPTPVNLGAYSTSFAPFSLVTASTVLSNPQGTADDDAAAAEATDSEEESEQVESLLLPASVSPKKPSAAAATKQPTSTDPALALPPKHHLLDPSATFPSLAGASAGAGASGSSSSSSPLRSPSMTLSRSARPSTTSLLLPDPPLRSILKQKAPSGNFIVKDEREGLRKNGRGRRHVVGWDGEKKLKAAREKRLDEQAVKVAAAAVAAAARDDDGAAADTGGAGGKDKGKGKAKEGASASGSASKSSSARATRSSARVTRSAATGFGNGGGGGGDDEPPRRRRGAGAGVPASSSSTSNGAGSAAPPPPSRKRDPTRIKYELHLDDPAQLRAPLLVLRASLETSRNSHSSVEDGGEAALPPIVGNGVGSSSSLLPRPLANATPLAPMPTPQQTTTGPTIGNILTLNDVENAYVSLKNAVFCLPSVLADEQASLEPLRTHGQALLGALTRDVENVKSFPLWVAEQPRPKADSDDQLMVDAADAPTGDADEPSSSPSLNRRAAAANPAAAAGPGAKASLTDAQMRRMRDELGTAQAAVKCAAACLRDARVVALFAPADLAKLIETVMSVALAPDLSVSVRRDFFPFLPFFLSSVAAATSAALPDLLVPTILPSLRATLTLDPRVDRFRQSLSESLDALAVLLPLHGQMMLDSQAWRLWLREATMGLWDGTKKMISTHDKAVKVLGRVVRILTVPVQTVTWNVERESVHAAISRDLHNLMTSSPPGADLDPTDAKKQRRLSYLQTLLSQIDVQASEKARAAGTDENATRQLAIVSVLALVPALLGGEFRFIDPKGIGPWMRAFNALSDSPSSPVLVLSALAWPHLAFAFLRTPGQPNRPWMFRDNSTRPLFNYLSIFRSRIKKDWQGAVDPTLDDGWKEQIRLQAKALALAFCGAIYGATVYVRYGTTSVRTANDPPDVPAHRLPMLDRIFKEMLEVYLPAMAKSETSNECNTIAWQILARICRPKSSSERPVLLESLVNPIFLDGTLAIIAPDSAKMNVLLDAAIQRSTTPAAIPGWSEQWLVANVAQVLKLFEDCLPDDADRDAQESLAIKEMSNAWRNLLRTLAGHPDAFSEAIQWLTRLNLGKATVAASLWTSLFAKGTEQYLSGVEAAMMVDSRALHLATKSYLAATEKRAGCAGVLAKVASRRLAQLRAGEKASQDLETAVTLLHELAKAEAPDELAKDQFRLGESIVRLVWSSREDSLAMRERVRGALTSPDDGASLTLRLCLMLVAGAQRLDEPVRQDALTFCGAIALSALGSDESSTSVELIASMLRCACNASYPHFYQSVLEYLRSTVAPTGDNLERFAPLLIEPLRRAIELATSAPDVDTQALLQASLVSEEPIPAHLQLIQSFEEFWRSTFAPLEQEVDLPADLSGLLQVVRAIVHVPEAETAETCSSTPTDSMPVPAQVAAAVPDGYRTTASEDRVVSSRGGYEADVSHLPLQQPGSALAHELEQDSTTASRHSQPRKVVSLSLRAPTAERADAGIDSPLAVEADTQMVDETQSDVLTREANASYAAMSSRVLSQETAEFATLEHDGHPDQARKVPDNRRRLRSSTASGSDVASSTEDSTSDTSSGRRRVGKRRRNAAARRESSSTSGLATSAAAVVAPARAGSVFNDSQADQHDLSSTADSHDQATEDIVRSFLSLPIDTVVSVGKRIGGSPSLRRLIDLGERAREYFERMNSASP